LDSTGVLYYDGAREIAEYNSAETAGALTQAYVWGTQYVDELLMMFGQNGAYFAWQDANWKVIGLTTPGGRLAEEYNYTPYGRVLARRHTVFGDGDRGARRASPRRIVRDDARGWGYTGGDRVRLPRRPAAG